MPALRRLLRRLLSGALYYSGLLWIYAEFSLRRRAIVLMYHRVLPAGADTFSHPGIIVSPRTFAAQLKFLKRHFRLLTPEAFSAELNGPGFGRRACLVTFDDGWQDNFRHAFPLLQQHGIPAVVFVSTAHVGTMTTFWQERLTRLLYLATRAPAGGAGVLEELGATDARSMDDSGAKRRARDIVTSLKRRHRSEIDQWLSRLEADQVGSGSHPLDLGADRLLSWDEVQALEQSGLVTIGSHAHSHLPLPALGYAGAREDLSRSCQEMLAHGIPATRICAYPNGNVDDAVAAAAKDAGFELGFATGNGRVREGDDPLHLRRINIHEQSTGTPAEFLCLILGVH